MTHPAEKASSAYRLPEDVIPLHYDLDIITYLEPDNFSFHGDVRIKIRCLTPTKTVTINARDLTFASDAVSIKSAVGMPEKSLLVVDTTLDKENELFIIKTAENLAAEHQYTLHLSFHGLLKENLIGYYRSSYFDKSTQSVKWLTVTHFEPSDARQAFPCFDEPGLKATFTIRLAHKKFYEAVSNMPLKSKVAFNGRPEWIWSEFETTVPMSTYLVAYMVSEFKFKQSDPQSNNIIFRVWARPDAIDQTGFPSIVGPKFLAFYEDFFGVKYPLPKQDLLAIPDFKIGAMENWGIITFRESALLLDKKAASSSTKHHVAKIIAHELAHMWFGNLVTMFWWTDLWLKEGFATYMSALAVNHEFPEWNSLDAEALSDLLRVFHLDSLKSSHPVSVPIGHAREISQIFDAISYDKGSFLLRMMSLFLGEEVFRHGVSEYLKRHKFGNAEQDDLWASLTEQAHRYNVLPPDLSVKEIMDTWTLQTGYPLITVERDYETLKASVSQKRYLAISSQDPSDYVGSWWVPLSCSTAKEPNFNRTQPDHWLPQGKESMVLDVKGSIDDWFILNNRAAGLYRVNYDLRNWQLLVNILNSPHYTHIDVMNRALLIVDAMDLANLGLVKHELALSLLSYVKREDGFAPWNAALSKLDPIRTKMSRTSNFGMFKKFVQNLMTRIVKDLGDISQEPASFERARLINIITQWAVSFNVANSRDQAAGLFHQWESITDPDISNPIPKDIRQAVYTHAVEVGGEKAWNFLWERYKNANVIAEKNNILMALTNAKDIWLIERYLEWTLNEESGIRKQDAFLIFTVTARKDFGFMVAQKFFFRNIERISAYFGANSNLIGHYVSAIANQMIHKYDYEKLKAFSETYEDLLAPASLTVKQALESVELNIRWMEEHYDSISLTLTKLTE